MRRRVRGVAATRARLRRVAAAAEGAAKGVVMRTTLDVHAGARVAAPVDTGRLRNSLAWEIDASGLNAVVGTNVSYAPFLEFGTRFMPAQPYLFPALEAERRTFARAMNQAVGRVLREAGA